jgi:hypothetical protein
MTPRVDAKVEAPIEDIEEVLWGYHKCPFDELIWYTTRARGRAIRRVAKGGTDFVSCDRAVTACREGWWVILE